MAVLSLTDMPPGSRKDFFLYVDEFQNCATDSFSTILSEARKYALSLTPAHQYLGQLDQKIRDAVFGNVGIFIAFRTSEADAGILGRRFGAQLSSSHFTGLDNFELGARLLNREPFPDSPGRRSPKRTVVRRPKTGKDTQAANGAGPTWDALGLVRIVRGGSGDRSPAGTVTAIPQSDT